MRSLKFKFIKLNGIENFQFSVILATCQGLNSHMWPGAPILDSADQEYCHRHRKFCWMPSSKPRQEGEIWAAESTQCLHSSRGARGLGFPQSWPLESHAHTDSHRCWNQADKSHYYGKLRDASRKSRPTTHSGDLASPEGQLPPAGDWGQAVQKRILAAQALHAGCSTSHQTLVNQKATKANNSCGTLVVGKGRLAKQ